MNSIALHEVRDTIYWQDKSVDDTMRELLHTAPEEPAPHPAMLPDGNKWLVVDADGVILARGLDFITAGLMVLHESDLNRSRV